MRTGVPEGQLEMAFIGPGAVVHTTRFVLASDAPQRLDRGAAIRASSVNSVKRPTSRVDLPLLNGMDDRIIVDGSPALALSFEAVEAGCQLTQVGTRRILHPVSSTLMPAEQRQPGQKKQQYVRVEKVLLSIFAGTKCYTVWWWLI